MAELAPPTGLPVLHRDGMAGQLVGPDRWRDGYFLVQFADGVRAAHSSSHLFVNGYSLDRIIESMPPLDGTWSAEQLLAALERQSAELLRQEEQKRYQETHRQERRAAVFADIRRILQADFLSADSYFEAQEQTDVSAEEFSDEKSRFVGEWISDRHQRSDGTHSPPIPDLEQLRAISAVNGDIQVVARAGSGKTSTMVSRVQFLVEHCAVSPRDVLMLAFNRKAAQEMRRKLLSLFSDGAEAAVLSEIESKTKSAGSRGKQARVDVETQAVDCIAENRNVTLPHSMTFHALANAIVHPDQSILVDGGDSDGNGLSVVFQQVIDDHLRSPRYRDIVRSLMLEHFRDDWESIERGGYDFGVDDLIAFRRSLPRSSLAGDPVKSFGEKLIANFLIEHEVPYKYERNHRWGGINYRPDFTLFRKTGNQQIGVIIEYFGLAGDRDYDEMSAQKRDYWLGKPEWSFLEYGPSDIASRGPEQFLHALRLELQGYGFPCNKLSEDDLWHKVKDRALDIFTKTMVGFVGRCRKLSLTPDELLMKIDAHTPLTDCEDRFARLAHVFYSAYLRRLTETGEDDFDGLLQQAAGRVDSGVTWFERKQTGAGDLKKLRFICIDEFQDFSELFYRLLTAIRKQNGAVQLFCVGDDWQAINGFAGSDLKYFLKFEKFVGSSLWLPITTNYRSAKAVVEIGNALMRGYGIPAKSRTRASPGDVVLVDMGAFSPTPTESDQHRGDDITPTILRIATKSIEAGHRVVVLSRTNRILWYVNYDRLNGQTNSKGLDRYLELLRSFLPEHQREMIALSTTHKFKGLERHTVIVIDAVARCYPLVHPSWIFTRVLGTSVNGIVEEERRLLYVGLTRASERLYVVTRKGEESPFLDDIRTSASIAWLDWDFYPPPAGAADWVLVRVSNQPGRKVKSSSGALDSPTFAIKDILKATGYRFSSVGEPCWEKAFGAESFAIEQVMSEQWSHNADGVCIRVFDGNQNLLSSHSIDKGTWS